MIIEHQRIEWKACWRDEYLKWICAFANAQGGVLEIGRNDAGQVIGVKNPKKLMEDLPNKILDLLGIVADVELFEEDSIPYIRITVEPYPYPVSFKGEYHVRVGSTKQVLRGAALDRFLLNRTGKRWDAVPVSGVSLRDLDLQVLTKFRERAAASKRLTPGDLKEDDFSLINKLHLVEDSYLKRAAILLFHPDPEKLITGTYIKIGFFESDSDLLYQDEVHGALFTQPDSVIDLLQAKYLKALIHYEGLQRIETYPLPFDALREALLNAVAHNDYSGGVPIQISVYADKLIIWNNGVLPENWTVDSLLTKHNSKPHNPDIANVFYRAGMIEAWGRGISMMMKACREHAIPAPVLRYDAPGMWVEFTYSKEFIRKVVQTSHGAPVGTKLALSRHQVAVLRKCRIDSKLVELIALTNRSDRTKFRRQILNPLLEDGLVEMTSPKKPRSSKQMYRITDRGIQVLQNMIELQHD